MLYTSFYTFFCLVCFANVSPESGVNTYCLPTAIKQQKKDVVLLLIYLMVECVEPNIKTQI